MKRFIPNHAAASVLLLFRSNKKLWISLLICLACSQVLLVLTVTISTEIYRYVNAMSGLKADAEYLTEQTYSSDIAQQIIHLAQADDAIVATPALILEEQCKTHWLDSQTKRSWVEVDGELVRKKVKREQWIPSGGYQIRFVFGQFLPARLTMKVFDSQRQTLGYVEVVDWGSTYIRTTGNILQTNPSINGELSFNDAASKATIDHQWQEQVDYFLSAPNASNRLGPFHYSRYEQAFILDEENKQAMIANLTSLERYLSSYLPYRLGFAFENIATVWERPDPALTQLDRVRQLAAVIFGDGMEGKDPLKQRGLYSSKLFRSIFPSAFNYRSVRFACESMEPFTLRAFGNFRHRPWQGENPHQIIANKETLSDQMRATYNSVILGSSSSQRIMGFIAHLEESLGLMGELKLVDDESALARNTRFAMLFCSVLLVGLLLAVFASLVQRQLNVLRNELFLLRCYGANGLTVLLICAFFVLLMATVLGSLALIFLHGEYNRVLSYYDYPDVLFPARVLVMSLATICLLWLSIWWLLFHFLRKELSTR